MPVHKVNGGFKWGKSGKTYPNKAGAERQARAIYANGYHGDEMEYCDNVEIAKRVEKGKENG